ncbi:unnamed protein product, partial [Ectocarpus sp. 8 AP-2014]
GGSQGGSLRHLRDILRTASSHSNLKAIAAEASSSPPHVQFRPAVASSSLAPRLPGAAESIATEAGEGSRADPATTHVGQQPAGMPIPSAAKETRSEATPAVDGEDKGSSPVAPSVTATPGEAHLTTGEEAERSSPGGGATLEATSKA